VKKILNIPFHPFLFSTYAILGVYATNANEIPVAQIVRPLLIIFLATGAIYYFFTKRNNDLGRAGYLTTLVILWFFYFGHLFFFISFFPALRNLPYKQVVTTLAWAALLLSLGTRKLWKQFRDPDSVTRLLNVVSLIVVAFPLATTAYIAYETKSQQKTIGQHQADQVVPNLISSSNPPDIYYIVLDGYGRNDILDELYGINNDKFTDYLAQKGFFVANQATSNYMQTELSLSSILNMQYLDYLTENMGKSQNRGPLNLLIHNSLVRKALAEVGYDFTALPSAVLFTQIRNADNYISYSKNPVTEFEGLLITKTVIGAYVDDLQLELPLPNYFTHRKTIAFNLEALSAIQDSAKPKFIFAHILAPHPPFVFDQYGNPTQPDRPYFIGDATGFLGTNEEYIKGYSQEVAYINSQITLVIDTILKNSNGNAIIIIHGDHGPGAFTSFVDSDKSCLSERFSVLLAIYLPNQGYSHFRSNMSLVNLFPILFNTYFSSNLPILEDRSYYASWTRPYEFIDVTEKLEEECTIERIMQLSP
jgi:hypothetical protein